MGFKYRTDVGEIDLLAKHKRKNAWLVIELKRGRTSDIAVGQALRYRGWWVRKRLAARNEKVKTLIIGYVKTMINYYMRSTELMTSTFWFIKFPFHLKNRILI